MNKNKYYCKINGTIYNLSKIQNLIDENKFNGSITLSLYEDKIFEDCIDASTFEEVIKFNNNEIPADYNECLERMREFNRSRINRNLPKCPTCGSTRIRKIGTGERVASVLGLGILSKKINKTWKCSNCGHTW